MITYTILGVPYWKYSRRGPLRGFEVSTGFQFQVRGNLYVLDRDVIEIPRSSKSPKLVPKS